MGSYVCLHTRCGSACFTVGKRVSKSRILRLLSPCRRRMQLFGGDAVNICVLTWEPLASQKCRNVRVVDTLICSCYRGVIAFSEDLVL